MIRMLAFMKFKFCRLVMVSTLSVGICSSCSSPALKAPSAKVSQFLAEKPGLKNERKTTPFALSGGTLVAPQGGIYISPVSLKYLRPASKSLAKTEGSEVGREDAAKKLAIYGREQFSLAFKKSDSPRYKLQESINNDCLVLELAITELNRNTITGAVPRFIINNLAFPGTDALLAKATRGLKGNISIEGKLLNPKTGEILYQFADSEESRSAFLLPITDFTPYGQAREALRNWAKQFEKLTRTPGGKRVKDTGVVSLF